MRIPILAIPSPLPNSFTETRYHADMAAYRLLVVFSTLLLACSESDGWRKNARVGNPADFLSAPAGVLLDSGDAYVAGLQSVGTNLSVRIAAYTQGTATWSTPTEVETWSSSPGHPTTSGTLAFDGLGNLFTTHNEADGSVVLGRYDATAKVWERAARDMPGQLAVSKNGDAIYTTSDRQGLRTLRYLAGQGWKEGPAIVAETIATQSPADRLEVTLAEDGYALVAWTYGQQPGLGVRAAILPRDGTAFSETTQFVAPGMYPMGNGTARATLALTMGTHGASLVAWSCDVEAELCVARANKSLAWSLEDPLLSEKRVSGLRWASALQSRDGHGWLWFEKGYLSSDEVQTEFTARVLHSPAPATAWIESTTLFGAMPPLAALDSEDRALFLTVDATGNWKFRRHDPRTDRWDSLPGFHTPEGSQNPILSTNRRGGVLVVWESFDYSRMAWDGVWAKVFTP